MDMAAKAVRARHGSVIVMARKELQQNLFEFPYCSQLMLYL